MGYAIGDVVWLRRNTGLAELRGRVGTNLGKVGDVWADEDGEHISVVYEDEQVLALDLAASEFVVERRRVAAPLRPHAPGERGAAVRPEAPQQLASRGDRPGPVGGVYDALRLPQRVPQGANGERQRTARGCGLFDQRR